MQGIRSALLQHDLAMRPLHREAGRHVGLRAGIAQRGALFQQPPAMQPTLHQHFPVAPLTHNWPGSEWGNPLMCGGTTKVFPTITILYFTSKHVGLH